MKKLAGAFLFFLCATAHSASGEVVSALSVSSGAIIATISGYEPVPRTDTITKNFDVRWLSFQSRILAAVFEFQVGLASEKKATQLMETRTGIQYYPFAYGADFEDFHENNIVRYGASLKPYLHAKVGYGRYLIGLSDSQGAAEISSNYISLGGGLGAQYQLTSSLALDSQIDTSMAFGNSEVGFSGFYIRPRFGLLLYL